MHLTRNTETVVAALGDPTCADVGQHVYAHGCYMGDEDRDAEFWALSKTCSGWQRAWTLFLAHPTWSQAWRSRVPPGRSGFRVAFPLFLQSLERAASSTTDLTSPLAIRLPWFSHRSLLSMALVTAVRERGMPSLVPLNHPDVKGWLSLFVRVSRRGSSPLWKWASDHHLMPNTSQRLHTMLLAARASLPSAEWEDAELWNAGEWHSLDDYSFLKLACELIETTILANVTSGYRDLYALYLAVMMKTVMPGATDNNLAHYLLHHLRLCETRALTTALRSEEHT